MPRQIDGIKESVYINVRFPPKLVEEMDNIVRNGRFSSRSDLVTTAVRDYLDTIHARENGQVFNSRHDSGPRT
jgi:Arc/MetJ-type ribon-helix-helix transcriptional regulator